MLDAFIKTFYQEEGISSLPPLDKQGMYHIVVGDFEVKAKDLSPGVYFSSSLAPYLKEKEEDFLSWIMAANFMGQGTGEATIGLVEDESFLTLSQDMPYEMNYITFKDALEKFINYLDYWKKEISRFRKEGR